MSGRIIPALLVGLFLSSCPVSELKGEDFFANTYGGSGNDWAYSIQQTTDGGYVLSGPTTSSGAGGYDYWIVKLDPDGNVIWQKTYGGSSDDIPNAMQQTSDGGYVLAGRTQSFGAGSFDVWVLKLDSSGDRVWQRTFGGTGYDAAYSVRQTADGGYIVAGWTSSYGAGGYDYWILKLDSLGNNVWQRAYGGSSTDVPYASCLTSDGGVVVAGGTVSFGAGGNDVWIIKLDSTGARVWQKAYGGSQDDIAFAIQTTTDGGFIVAGRTDSYGTATDVWILKLDSTGDLEWEKTYGGTALDWAFAVQQAADGGYLVAGRTDSFGSGNADAWILKLDASGKIEWERVYGGTSLDYAYSACQAADGSFIVAGVMASFGAGNYDAMLLKLEPSCMLGNSCPLLAGTTAVLTASSPTVMDTNRNPASTASASSTTVPSSSNATATKSVLCSYPVLPDGITLSVSKAGGDPVLSWQAPAGTCPVTGYEIYRGTLPIVEYDHESVDCDVTELSYVDYSADDNNYYLVVPCNAWVEGSYGSAYNGYVWTERPASSSPCLSQCLLSCP